MEFSELVKERYSCRKLSDREVEPEKLKRIISAALAAPTAKNLQPVKLWLFESEQALENMKKANTCTFGAKHFILVGSRRQDAFQRPFDEYNYAPVDAAIVASHIMLAITAEGLASTWVGYFDAPRLKELYPEMAEYDLVAIFPIGYASEEAAGQPSPRHSQRKTADELVIKL